METKLIGIACDHAGYELKLEIIDFLKEQGYSVRDFGCNSNASCDYPDYAHPLGEGIDNNDFEQGVVICGSGNGINMTVNKHKNVRSAICWNTEIAALARQHNDANVCSLPSRFVKKELIFEILKIFLSEKFEGGRHQNRVNKIPIA